MKFKGTKGKWSVGTAPSGETDNILVKKQNKIITVQDEKGKCVGLFGRINKKETKANAKLIAASPEMFEMLKGILQTNEVDLDEIEQLLTKITE